MIRVESLTIIRGGVRAIDGVSFAAAPGETVAVIGGSGAGKSTLLLAAAGGLPPAAGSVFVEAGTRIGYVPSLLAAWPVVRADEFLEFTAAASGLSGKPLHGAVARGLALAGLADRPGTRIDALSDGVRKRLLVARALLDDPDILLIDDPFGSLDPAGCGEVERLVEDTGLAGRVVIAAVNSASLASCWSRVIVMQAGRIIDDRAAPADARDEPWWGERLIDPRFRGRGFGA